ncbi:three-helix bundle dimerization domain-containing protein [Streptomyces sp. NPDC048191]|uniref:three-helix bundle dimerization domain-containing protein n=1 Tax=Streptomyces sp. NPDC048191 TaxID=3155484 RepID=UPI0033EBC358
MNEEQCTAIAIAERLRVAYPSVDPSAILQAVQDAHQDLKDARVSAYVPILIERRAKTTLEQGNAAGTTGYER